MTRLDTGPCPRLAGLPEGRAINGVKLLLISLICFNNFIQKGGVSALFPPQKGPCSRGAVGLVGTLRRMLNWPGVRLPGRKP